MKFKNRTELAKYFDSHKDEYDDVWYDCKLCVEEEKRKKDEFYKIEKRPAKISNVKNYLKERNRQWRVFWGKTHRFTRLREIGLKRHLVSYHPECFKKVKVMVEQTILI